MPGWETLLLSLLTLLLGSGGALLLVRAQARKLRAERQKIGADTLSALADALEKMRAKNAACEERENELEREIEGYCAELQKLTRQTSECERLSGLLRERLAALEDRYPFAVVLDSLHRIDAAWIPFRDCPLPMVVTLDHDAEGRSEPRFHRVNRAFADALGMTMAEVIAAGPWALIEPHDESATRATEADARAGDPVSVVNTYRGRGVRVRFKWGSTPYMIASGQRDRCAIAWAAIVWREPISGAADDVSGS
jgi:hypothetical protein